MILGKAISPFALRKKNGGGGGTDADAQAFITATGISGTNATATNQLVLDLKSANIWTKMKCIYPFVGNTSASQKYNLKDARDLDAAYRLTFNGGGTFSANGYLPNGVNAYASTFLIPNTVFGVGFASIGVYVNQALTVGGTRAMGSTNMDITINNTLVRGTNKASTNTTVTATLPMDGFIVNSRINSTSTFFMNRNGTFSTGTITAASTYATTDIVLGATNSNGTILSYSNGQIAFSFCSDFLTQAEATTLKTIVQTFQTTLGRQV